MNKLLKIILALMPLMVAVGIASNASDTGRLMKIEFYKNRSKNETLGFEERSRVFDTLFRLCPHDLKMLKETARFYKENGKFNELLVTYRRIMGMTPAPSLSERLAALNGIAKTLKVMRNYADAVKEYLHIIQTAKHDSMTHYDVRAYLGCADIFSKTRVKSVEGWCLAIAEEKFEKMDSFTMGANGYLVLKSSLLHAHAIYDMGRDSLDRALSRLSRALSLSPSTLQRNYIAGNMARVFIAKGEYSMAEQYMRDLTHAESIDYIPDGDSVIEAYLFNKLGRFREAGELLGRFDMDDSRNDVFLLETRAETMAGIGQWEEAFKCLQRAMAVSDSAKDDAMLIPRWLDKDCDIDDAGYRVAYTDKAQPYNYVLAAVIILLVSDMLLGLVIYRPGLKKGKEAEDGMDRARLHAVLKYVKDELAETDKNADLRIANCRNFIAGAISEGDTVFHNKAFAEILLANHPDLSPAEIEISCYIVANFSSKEIAIATNRSVRTVDTIRYNLRKKLKCTEKTDVYLKGLYSHLVS